MRGHMYGRVHGHVHGQVHEHVHGHGRVCGHVCGHMHERVYGDVKIVPGMRRVVLGDGAARQMAAAARVPA